MKFYECDGTFRVAGNSGFGWWCEDILADGKGTSSSHAERIEKHFPAVEIYAVASFQETLKSPEGCSQLPEEFANGANLSPAKEQLCKLIAPGNTMKSEQLMLIVGFKGANYEEKRAEEVWKESSRQCGKFCGWPTPASLRSRKIRGAPMDPLKFLESTAFLNRSTEKLRKQVKDMQKELQTIRLQFKEEDERTIGLLRECRKLLNDITESNYLNEILLLLMGRVEKIKSNNWPFKICSNSDKDLNYIV